jgi:hypothetical protein
MPGHNHGISALIKTLLTQGRFSIHLRDFYYTCLYIRWIGMFPDMPHKQTFVIPSLKETTKWALIANELEGVLSVNVMPDISKCLITNPTVSTPIMVWLLKCNSSPSYLTSH